MKIERYIYIYILEKLSLYYLYNIFVIKGEDFQELISRDTEKENEKPLGEKKKRINRKIYNQSLYI